MPPFGSSGMTSYSSSIVTVAVARTICEIFTFELYGDLETGCGVNQGHRKCHHSIAWSLDMVSYSTSIVIVAVSHTVSDIH